MAQHADRQLFSSTIWEDAGLAPQNFGISGDQLDECRKDALSAVGLREDLWQRSPLQLSIGERKKAALAGVIAAAPDILLLDDPFAEMDENGISAVCRLILDYISRGKTVVVTRAGECNNV